MATAKRVVRNSKDDGYGGCGLLHGGDGASRRDDDVRPAPDELGRDFGEAFGPSFRPLILDRNGTTGGPAKFAQPLLKSSDKWRPDRSGSRAQNADGRQISGLLRPPGQRPRRRAANECDELASPHS